MSSFLHVHSMYSLHDSTQTPNEIVKKTKDMGVNNVTLTDHGTLLGIESFMDAGKKYNVNTIPGVEAYISKRNHLVLVAKNYKGYVDISHSMRDANTNIEKLLKLTYPVMTDEMLEKYFKGNEDVIATSACIQGPIGYILLTNYRIKKKISKDEKICSELKPFFDNWNLLNSEYKGLVNEISTLKKEKNKYIKYTKPAYALKIKKLQQKVDELEEGSDKYKNNSIKLEEALFNKSIAEKTVADIDIDIELKEKNKALKKKERDNLKGYKDKYIKAKQRIDDVEYIDNEKLYKEAKNRLLYLKSVFPNFYIELQNHGLEQEAYVMPILVKLARETNTPIIAANDAHMLDNSEESIEARRIVRFNYFKRSQEVSDADKTMYLKSDEELTKTLALIVGENIAKEAVSNTSVLEDCKVIFPEEKHYPAAKIDQTFDELLMQAKQKMIKNNEWNEIYENRLNHEIKIIKTMGYEDYHMIVRDFCNIARKLGVVPKDRIKDIPQDFSKVDEWLEKNGFAEGIGVGPGRGSAAGSLVCYLLGITNIDPIKYNLLFERFLNPERVSMPDIDTDVKKSLRPVIIRYIKWKYGESSVCSIATETTYAAKGAIQMAGRDRSYQLYQDKDNNEALIRSYLYSHTLKISDMIPETPDIKLKDVEKEVLEEIKENDELMLIWNRAKLIEGKLSGTGVHAGGIIISDNDNVNDYIPLAWNEEKKVWAAQCDMVKTEEKGLLKMDLLGLNTLDCISDCIHLIKKYHGISIDIDKIPFEKEVFEEIYSKGNTNSVFQVESSGMKSMMKDFKPTCFEDIILLIACYRPGPMQYLKNIIAVKNGQKEITYKTPELESILSTTYGATVYQEQVMEIFQKLAGYSLGSADLVRRAMSKKKFDKLEIEREAFINGDNSRNIDGCIKKGISENIANELFDEMMDFARYAFNKSHAAVYAYVSYRTAWLKYHYPTEFLCSMFNNKEQDKFAPIIEDCNIYNIKLLPPNINKSFYEFVLEDNNIRFGISGIKGIGSKNENYINCICKNRKEGNYASIHDFLKRNLIHTNDKISIPDKKILEAFVNSGMFDTLGYNREALVLELNSKISVDKSSDALKVIYDYIDNIKIEETLPNITYNISKEIECLGTIISEQPLNKYLEDKYYNCTPISELKSDNNIQIFGFIASVKNKKSSKGRDMLILDVQGKTGECKVFIMGHLYKNYINRIQDLEHKVLKVTGSCKDKSIFASRIQYLHPNLDEYYIELTTLQATEFLQNILSKEKNNRNIPVKVNCHWLVDDKKNYYLTDKPKICELKFTEEEINYIQKEGVKINKWGKTF